MARFADGEVAIVTARRAGAAARLRPGRARPGRRPQCTHTGQARQTRRASGRARRQAIGIAEIFARSRSEPPLERAVEAYGRADIFVHCPVTATDPSAPLGRQRGVMPLYGGSLLE